MSKQYAISSVKNSKNMTRFFLVLLLIFFLFRSLFANEHDTKKTHSKRNLKDSRTSHEHSHAPITCENSHRRLKFDRYLRVAKDSPLKNQLLREFLCAKFFQHFDTIYKLTFEENRKNLEEFKILENKWADKSTRRHGTDSCDLTNTALDDLDGSVEVCPWYWEISYRLPKKRHLCLTAIRLIMII